MQKRQQPDQIFSRGERRPAVESTLQQGNVRVVLFVDVNAVRDFDNCRRERAGGMT